MWKSVFSIMLQDCKDAEPHVGMCWSCCFVFSDTDSLAAPCMSLCHGSQEHGLWTILSVLRVESLIICVLALAFSRLFVPYL